MLRTLTALGLCLTACGGPTPPPPPAAVTWEADIRPVVERSCSPCHRSDGIGPFALTSYDEVSKFKEASRAAIEARRMPPYLAGRGCADYAGDISLSDEEVARFGRWVDEGATKGEVASAPAPLDSPPAFRVDRTLGLARPYSVTGAPDDYRCFVLDWPETTERYVTGVRVVPGNPKVVHHVIAHLVLPERVADVMALDSADPGDGYACFGGPGAGIRQWLGGWAPGGQGSMYPKDTGLLVPRGSKVVLQVHYNVLAGGAAPTDQTHIEVALADTVARRAVLFLWTNPEWVAGRGMRIPAFESDVKHAFAFDPTPVMASLTGGAVANQTPFQLYSANVHQHLLGKSSRFEILRGDGVKRECLLDIPRWDFHWQRSYGFTAPKVFRPGDRLSLTCHWDNSGQAQPLINGNRQQPRDVSWGEGTTDEMCLGVLYVTQ